MKTCVLTVSLLTTIPYLVHAQPSAAQPNDLTEISETLKRIEVALKRQTEIQKADVLLRRVMFASTQMATAQANLKKIDDDLRSLRSEGNELESTAKRLEETAESEARRIQLSYARNRMALIQEHLTALEQDRVSIENEIQALRRDSREWQTLLDKTLAVP